MKPSAPIEDHYGTKLEVDCAFKSAGPAVYLDRREGMKRLGSDSTTMDRFTPEQARELAKRLVEAADEIEGVRS